MSIATVVKKAIFYPHNTANASAIKTCLDAIVTKVNAITTGAAGFLTADADGRAVMASGYFDEATATAKFAAQAITGALLKNATVTATQLASNAVETAKILDANVTQAKIAPSALDATVVAVGAAANTLGFIPVCYQITVADGSTVLTGQTLDATYGKTVIDDVYFIKGGSTGSTTDAVQLCTDSGGTTAVSSSLDLNTIAAGGVVRTTSLLNNTFAAGAIFYVKRTHTTDCSGTLVIKGHLSA
jgi:phage-related tail protein